MLHWSSNRITYAGLDCSLCPQLKRPTLRGKTMGANIAQADYQVKPESPTNVAPSSNLPRPLSQRPSSHGPLMPAPTGGYMAFKGAADLCMASILILFAAPVILICGLLVRLTSPGPALYSQVRLGLKGRPFRIFKLRTMRNDCEKVGGVQWSKPGDPRVTWIGRILRKTHLDELPQLWNVLRGDMSLVGPRPERPEFTPSLEKAIPRYRDRLCVKPGVTGLAQVQLPPDTDVHSVRRKLAFDLHYIGRIGLWLDLRLILCTALHMLAVPYATLGRLFGLPRPETDRAPHVPTNTPPSSAHG
jgi:lipopolysaccharide/colanic/teichoic acid biosynthesis glycosyltransferase